MYEQDVDLLRAEAARCLRLAFSITDAAASEMLHRHAGELIDRLEMARAGSLAHAHLSPSAGPFRLLA
jgi:hypothetical protein